jgi:MFS family permease
LQTELLGPDNPITYQGIAQALGGVASVLAAPIVGALSDRTSARFGRRRSWILICTLIAAAALVWLANSMALWMIFVGWFVLQFMGDALRGTMQAIIPDRVPQDQRGLLSSYVGLAISLGSVFGSLVVAVVFKNSQITAYYVFLGSLVIVPLFLMIYKEKPLAPAEVPPFNLKQFLSRFWVSPRKHPDFAWAFITRLLFFLGYFLVVLFLRNYMKDGLKYQDLFPGRTVDQAVLTVQSTLLIPVILSSVISGIISDRLQRRKLIVFIACMIAGVAYLLPAVISSWTVILIWAILLGIGYGAFFAIDTALAIQVLPRAEDRGKDLGIIALAMAIPQIFAPLISSRLLASTGNNFMLLFASAGIITLLAGIFVLRIKSVR